MEIKEARAKRDFEIKIELEDRLAQIARGKQECDRVAFQALKFRLMALDARYRPNIQVQSKQLPPEEYKKLLDALGGDSDEEIEECRKRLKGIG